MALNFDNSLAPLPPPDGKIISNTACRFAELVKEFVESPACASAAVYEAAQEDETASRLGLEGFGPKTTVIASVSNEMMAKPGSLPIFTKFVEGKVPFENLLTVPLAGIQHPERFINKDFVVILNAQSPYTALFPGGRKEKEPPGMSFAHLLAVPKARIYNACTLTNGHLSMVTDMEATVRALVDEPAMRAYIAEKVSSMVIERLTKLKAAGEMFDEAGVFVRFAADKDAFVSATHGSDMEFFFHVHPYHSVGQLHMHCIQSNLRTSRLHDWKNMPLAAIKQQIRPHNTMRDAGLLILLLAVFIGAGMAIKGRK